ncbi:MAG: hypothetical protein V3V20_06775 [Algisphaera sp.]
MFSKATLIAALAVTSSVSQFASASSVPTLDFLASEVVVQADVATPVFIRTAASLGDIVQSSDLEVRMSAAGEDISGAIGTVHSLFQSNGDLAMAGTSHHTSRVLDPNCDLLDTPSAIFPAFYHEIRTTINAVKTTIFSLWAAPESSEIGFDRELLASLSITDAIGNAVDISTQLAALNGDSSARMLEITLAPGTYSTHIGVGSGLRAGDDEFQLRSNVTAAPTPSAAIAGLMGLGALLGRRRRTA